MKKHHLAAWPPSFYPAWIYPHMQKIHANRRDFEVGDFVCLWEYNPVRQHYTGRHANGVITRLKSLGDNVVIDISIVSREERPDYTETIP
jgi:hypothetical protein